MQCSPAQGLTQCSVSLRGVTYFEYLRETNFQLNNSSLLIRGPGGLVSLRKNAKNTRVPATLKRHGLKIVKYCRLSNLLHLTKSIAALRFLSFFILFFLTF